MYFHCGCKTGKLHIYTAIKLGCDFLTPTFGYIYDAYVHVTVRFAFSISLNWYCLKNTHSLCGKVGQCRRTGLVEGPKKKKHKDKIKNMKRTIFTFYEWEGLDVHGIPKLAFSKAFSPLKWLSRGIIGAYLFALTCGTRRILRITRDLHNT